MTVATYAHIIKRVEQWSAGRADARWWLATTFLDGREGGRGACSDALKAGASVDEQTEGMLKLFGYLLIAPFWITWKILQLLWGLFKAVTEDTHQKKAAKLQAQVTPAEQAREAARQKQLEALRATLPSGLPDRMRATIQINEVKHPRIKQERIHHLIGEDTFVHAEAGEIKKYAVDMVLQMTETERATIKQHQLDDIVLEDVPLFTEDELVSARIDDQARIDAAKDPLHKAVEKQMMEMTDEMKKHERRKTRIGDLLVSPFSRIFDAPHDANEYARKLKTEFLPKMRQLLDRYREYKQTETLEF